MREWNWKWWHGFFLAAVLGAVVLWEPARWVGAIFVIYLAAMAGVGDYQHQKKMRAKMDEEAEAQKRWRKEVEEEEIRKLMKKGKKKGK